MTLKEFAKMLDGRVYGHEITLDEEALAKELGFVVVFGYSDDNAELRGAIDDEIGCFDGGVLEHKDLPSGIYADWCPEDLDCSWAYSTSIPHEKFHIYDDGELYCVGIVCDINKPKHTNADRIRAMSDEELAQSLSKTVVDAMCYLPLGKKTVEKMPKEMWDDLVKEYLKWLKQPAEENDNG